MKDDILQNKPYNNCVLSSYPNKFKRCDDPQLITRWSKTCSELLPILETAWKTFQDFIIAQPLNETFSFFDMLYSSNAI
jgi:hypothetical protein